jgi:hypothetical protein
MPIMFHVYAHKARSHNLLDCLVFEPAQQGRRTARRILMMMVVVVVVELFELG